MSNRANDIKWAEIFEKYRLLEKIAESGRTSISAATIKEFREPRLMAKFDHRSQLPELFVKNKLSILPTSRGTYEVGHFETYCDFGNDDANVSHIHFPASLESINYNEISSEAIAINCAFVSRMLHDFTGETELFPTVSGRMGSSRFDFNINSRGGQLGVCVKNAQVEIDGGYEGDRSLNLIEAKNYISDDFLIRQLYYPYRLWSGKISKRVRPIFLTYSNGVFHFREYEFTDDLSYNSIRLVKYRKYAVWEGAINIEAILAILDSTKTVKEPEPPFPQADSFERVINLCELLKQRGFLSKEEITMNYDFAHRQTDYYSNSAKYLGLAEGAREGGKIGCRLTEAGLRVFSMPVRERQLELVRLILSHKAFNSALRLYLDKGAEPTKDEIVEIMKRSELRGIGSDDTYYRRSSSIIKWSNWILELIEE